MKKPMRLKKYLIFIAACFLTLFMIMPVEAKPLEVKWYKPHFDGAASLNLPSDDTTGIKFDFDGQVVPKYSALLVTVILNNEQVNYYYPVDKGETTGKVYLRFGKGTYKIQINLVKPNPDPSKIYFERLADIEMESVGIEDQSYLLPSWGIESDNDKVVNLAKTITKGIDGDYLRTKAIHDWVSQNIKYDMDKYRQNDIYTNKGALKTAEDRTGLCRDYSNLTTALLRASGVEARTVIGEVKVNGKWYGHAWNEAMVAGRWITFDTTWDAGILQGNKFIPKFSRKYFDVAAGVFSQTHRKTQELY